MNIFRTFFILLLLLFFCDYAFSNSALKYQPIKAIAGGEKSCDSGSGNKCKPWVVNIYVQSNSDTQYALCSGSVIARKYVLTAAHCQKKNIKKYIIKNYKNEEISTALPHSFIASYNGSDLAILKLESPVILVSYGHVRRFFNYDEAYEKFRNSYYDASIYGYGSFGINKITGAQVRNSGDQYRADVKMFTTAPDSRNNQGLMVEENLNENLKPGIAQEGDSGGPLIWDDTIIGVVSWGYSYFEKKYQDSDSRSHFFVMSDVTGKYIDIGLSKKRSMSSWFSRTMNKIWIESPDWNSRLSRRGKSIVVKGFGRPNSDLKLDYSVGNKKNKVIKCKDLDNMKKEHSVDNFGKWKCDIPYDSYFTEFVTENKEYKVAIKARESKEDSRGWKEDIIQAKIPPEKEEFSIVYPTDKSIVLTKNFIIRGYADPNSNVKLILKSNSSDKSYTQDKICNGLEDKELIKTGEDGVWSCMIDYQLIIKSGDINKQYDIKITAMQNIGKVIIPDGINMILKPEDYTELKIEQSNESKNNIYRKNLIFDVNYSKYAKVVCVFNRKSFSCKNNTDGKGDFYLGNISAGRDNLNSHEKARFNISAIQKIEGADPFDPKLWSDINYESVGGYFPPDFNEVHDISHPKSILSAEIENNVITGFGGDNKRYTDMNNDIILPSEYSICMKKGGDSPLPPGSSLCSEKGDNNIYLKIPFKDSREFSELPIKYGNFSGRKNFPIWSITLPPTLKDGLYYLEVTDKYHPLGLPNFKETYYSILNKTYFQILTPNVEIKTPSVGDVNTVGTPSFVSGDANVPGDEVDVKKRKITFSLESQGKNNLNSAQETVICTGAIVNDNGQWECSRPVIFTAGTYELTAELMKAGKIVAKNTTYMTVKKKNNKDKDKFKSDYPKNNTTVDPDGTIQLFGSFGTVGGVVAGAGVAVVGLLGSIFGAVSGAVSLVAGLPATLWGVAINPNKLGGGDIYTLTLQETHYGQLVGDPIIWTFTVPMRITEPGLNAQYRVDNPISIKGEGTPGQLILIAGSQYLLSSRLTVGQVPENNLICQTTVNGGGTWACPNNPAMTAKLAGTFFLYGAQYKKTAPGNVDAMYERTSAVVRRYDITQTRINITAPRQGTKITVLPLTITGTGEPRAQVHLGSFGGTPKCNTDVEASGIWSCGPYQPEKGEYTLSAEQLINNQLHSTAQVSFDVQTDRIRPLVITQPHHGGVYRYQESVVPAGQGEPGTTICLAEQALEQVCQNGVTVDKEGRWTERDRLNTARKGEQTLVATAFLGQARQSTAKVTFQVEGADGERLLTVNVPGEAAVIKTPSYTFSGTLPANGRSVTVHAFGGNEGCTAELNLTSGSWTCGPYSAVPGDYRAVIEDDTGSRIARSFKVRYGDNLQMRVLEPAEGAQIDRPLYAINGTGQTGARITVTLAGEPVCETTVDEHQTWACQERQLSRQGDYQLLAQQWVDEVPSGKVVMRDYRVTYRIQDLSVLQPAEEVQITTPTYDIRGKGESGAQVTVAASGKPLCSAIVDGQQNWVCPRFVSSPGWYEIEARQTLEGYSWGKPVTRHYEVIYGMPDIVINSTAPAFCPPPNTGQPTSAFVTGKALPGSYITLNASAGHTCGTTQASAKGSWSCRLDNVWLGKFHLTAFPSLTPDGRPVGPTVEQEVTIRENTFRVLEPGNRVVYETRSPWGRVAHITMYGVGTPGAEVELEVVRASGWKTTSRVRVGNDGGWKYDGFQLDIGWYTLHASQQGCDKGSSADIHFSVTSKPITIPCPPHVICDN
ncbi:trypsin-like serine protease [Xenorhabdus bovienii]|uniref:Putative Trypsin n=1 Tax=Xenorhabdus bovienii TaxID=40576 RepID=A0A0B6X9Z1_XENBV|nr:trypsin-like serine protease [Xenorhabdus bovienii]CDM89981.1 putative Trypsin [Xenorhabdus bovienii]